MAVKKLVRIWDDEKVLKENIEFLRQSTKKVILPASEKTKSIIQDLIDTYKVTVCSGIAANQIGYNQSIFIGMKTKDNVDIDSIEEEEANLSQENGNPYPNNYEIYINPQIDKVDKKSMQIEEEGCLSIPYITATIPRYDKIKVRYYNELGQVKKKTLSEFLSKLFQHELDHLEGKLMIESENITSMKLTSNEKDYSKYHQLFKEYSILAENLRNV